MSAPGALPRDQAANAGLTAREADQPSPTARALTAAHEAQDAAERAHWEAERLGAGPDVLRDLGREADAAAAAVRVAAQAHRAARDAWRAAQ